MTLTRNSIVLLASMILIVGCGDPADNIIGTWSGKYDLSPELHEAMYAGMTAEEMSAVETRMNAMSFKLELNKDQTYSMSVKDSKTSGTLTGRWRLNDSGTRLTIRSPEINQEIRSQAAKLGYSATLFIDQEYSVEE